MTGQEAALVSLARRLDASGVPYMVIGGHANAVWGEPRATLDINVTVWLPESLVRRLVADLAPRFRPRVVDPERFVRETRVLPFETEEGLAVELIFGLLPFEEEAITRARPIRVAGQEVRFCTAEDLILLKIASTRKRDLDDVRGIARARGADLDFHYLEPRVRDLAERLERPAILDLWRELERSVRSAT